MKYLVTEVTDISITLWDEVTRDKDRPKGMGGLITLEIPHPEAFKVGDHVMVGVRLADD